MSAAQNSNKQGSAGFDFGTGKSNKSDDRAKKTTKAAIITVIAVVVLTAAALFINSDYIRQNMAAVKVDNVSYAVTDFNYYFQNMYAQYYNTMNGSGSFGQSILPNTSESLKSQVYDETTGETWADFFKKLALDQMKADNKIYKEALAHNFSLSDDDKKKLESDIDTMKQNGYGAGYSDLAKYLKAIYGRGMTEAVYRRNAERSYIISSYTTYVKEHNFTYDSATLESYYQQNKDSYDTFTYRYFHVSAGSITKTDYPDEASYNIALAAAIKAASETAASLAKNIKSEQTFIDAAKAYDPETNKDASATIRSYQGSMLGSTYGPWMKESARKNGDVSTFESTNGCYVVYYMTRDDNHYKTANINQIVVKPETIDKTKYASEANDDKYNADVAAAKTKAQETAQKILTEWNNGAKTADAFKQLLTAHSAEISTTDSVESKNVYKKQLATTVSDWIYDSSRKAGDCTSTLLYDESTGYHIVYFEGEGMLYSDYLADKDKRDKDLQSWKDGLTGSDPKTTWLMTLAI